MKYIGNFCGIKRDRQPGDFDFYLNDYQIPLGLSLPAQHYDSAIASSSTPKISAGGHLLFCTNTSSISPNVKRHFTGLSNPAARSVSAPYLHLTSRPPRPKLLCRRLRIVLWRMGGKHTALALLHRLVEPITLDTLQVESMQGWYVDNVVGAVLYRFRVHRPSGEDTSGHGVCDVLLGLKPTLTIQI